MTSSPKIDNESEVSVIWIANMGLSKISVKVDSNKVTLDEDMIKSLNELNKERCIKGNVKVNIVEVGAEYSTKEESKENIEKLRKYSNTLVESGWNLLNKGCSLRLSIQSKSDIYYVSIESEGVIISDNLPVKKNIREIVVFDNGNIKQNSIISIAQSLPPMPKEILYNPHYIKQVKESINIMRRMYELGKKNKSQDLVTEENLNTLKQLSFELRSVNITSVELLLLASRDWLGRSVSLLYESNKSAKLFKLKYDETQKLIKKIGDEALQLAEGFNICSRWYDKLYHKLHDLEFNLGKNVEQDYEKVVIAMKKIISDLAIDDDELQSQTNEIDNIIRNLQNESDTIERKEINSCLREKVTALAHSITSKSNKKLEQVRKKVQQQESQNFWSRISQKCVEAWSITKLVLSNGLACSFFAFMCVKIVFEIDPRSRLLQMDKIIREGLAEASNNKDFASLVKQIGDMASSLLDLQQFCSNVSIWFTSQHLSFQNWGQFQIRSSKSDGKFYDEWSIDDFLNWLENNEDTKKYHKKYGQQIRNYLTNIWKPEEDDEFDEFSDDEKEKFNDADDNNNNNKLSTVWNGSYLKTTTDGDISKWGIKSSKKFLGFLQKKIKEDENEGNINQPYKFWNINIFISWFKSIKNGKFAHYQDKVIDYFSKEYKLWEGVYLQEVNKNNYEKKLQKWGIEKDDIEELWEELNELFEDKQLVPVNYWFWEKNYKKDLDFVKTNEKEINNMAQALINVSLSQFISTTDTYIPSKDDYGIVKFLDKVVSVQENAKKLSSLPETTTEQLSNIFF